MIECWDRFFDAIYCVHYLPHGGRLNFTINEFNRVGIAKSSLFHIRVTDKSCIDEEISSCKKYDGRKRYHINLCRELISIFNECIFNRRNRVLILENDVAFLKREDRIKEIICGMPNFCDIVQLSHFGNCDCGKDANTAERENNSINELFFTPKNLTLYGGDCVCLSYNAIVRLKKMIEEQLYPLDYCITKSDLFRAVCKENLCCQIAYDRETAITHHAAYDTICLDYSKYNVPCGYGYGFYEDEKSGVAKQV